MSRAALREERWIWPRALSDDLVTADGVRALVEVPLESLTKELGLFGVEYRHAGRRLCAYTEPSRAVFRLSCY